MIECGNPSIQIVSFVPASRIAAKKEPDPEIKRIIASRAAAFAQEAEALERRASFE
jgi:hypothetical protein